MEILPDAKLSQPFVAEFLKHAPSAIAMFDIELRYLMATDRWISDYGLQGETIIGRSHYEIFPEIPEDWRELHRRTLEGETLSAEADPFLRADGTLDYVRWRNVPWYDAAGNIGGMVMFTELITDQVLMQKAMEHAVGGVARLDNSGRYIYVNETYAGLFGMQPTDLLGKDWRRITAKQEADRIRAAHEEMKTTGKAIIETFGQRTDGSEVHAQLTMVADYSRDGELAGHYSFLRDITVRKLAEQEKDQKTEWLKMTQTMGHIGHWHVDLKNEKVFWSEEVYNIHGVSSDSYTPDLATAIECYHPEDQPKVQEAINKAVEETGTFEFELRLVRPDGEIRWVTSNGECSVDRYGKVVAIFGIFQDVTEARTRNEEIRLVKERCEIALHGAAVGIWEIDPDTNEANWSPIINDMLGYDTSAALSRRDIFHRVHLEDRELVDDYLQGLMSAKDSDHLTIRLRHVRGHDVYIQLRGNAIRNEEGEVTRLAGSFADITDEIRTEALRQEMWKILIIKGIRQSEKFERVLTKATEYFGLRLGLISKIDDDIYEVRHAVTPNGEVAAGDTFEFANTYCLHVYSGNGVRAFHHVGQSEIRHHPCYENFGLESYIGAPLYVAGKRFGTVNFSSPEAREKPFTPAELQLIEQLAQWVGYEIEREQNIASLKESEERFSLAAQGSSVGIWDWHDVDQSQQYWTDHFYSLLGYRPGEIEASLDTFTALLHPDDHKATFEAVEKHFADRVPFHMEYRLRCRDGQYRWFLGSGQAIWDQAGRPRRMIGSIMDIHERKKAETLKSEFVSTVSHELRTPMTSIIGSIGLVRSGKFGQLEPRAGQLLDIAMKNGERLVRLINDILDIEKIEAGKIDFSMEPETVSELVADAIEENLAFVEKNSAKISFVDHSESAVISADRDRIIQVLTNLISNAAKFTGADGRIVVEAKRDEDHIVVSVSDNGPGIPPDKLQAVFDKFVQVDSGDNRSNQGTGLGLSIAKAIAEAHDGDLLVESEVGYGTTFRLVLGIGPDDLELDDPRAESGRDSAKPGLMRSVLHVEDDRDLSALLRVLMGDLADVRGARSVAGARNALRGHNFDLVILDLCLVDQRGEALIDFIETELTDKPQVIVYSVEDCPVGDFPDFVIGSFVKSRISNESLLQGIMHALTQKTLPRPFPGERGHHA